MAMAYHKVPSIKTRPTSFQQPAQGKNMHTHSPLLPVAARAPFRHPTSPADTIHQRSSKSNAANWKVMTAKGLLDLHANSSILASHSQTTGLQQWHVWVAVVAAQILEDPTLGHACETQPEFQCLQQEKGWTPS
ncbi:uncharacterized protein LJ206_014752 isoform 1-T1 [Theristicus caerulescens]